MKMLELLKTARDIITPPEAWRVGDAGPYKILHGGSVCIEGAIMRTCRTDSYDNPRVLEALLLLKWHLPGDFRKEFPAESFCPGLYIQLFNDSQGHTEVLQLLDKAIAELEEPSKPSLHPLIEESLNVKEKDHAYETA